MKNKSTNTAKTENTRGKYKDKLTVKGSFLDIVHAVAKEANEKPKKKKNEN
ncbi:MAG: hypothetical protein KA138_03635 [Saprospiraceae bacterium]|nr:hypothetical protein [Lewinellaceae bacterium]MBP6810579.1 hypothetical protein [Saprospiraceae bacterium]